MSTFAIFIRRLHSSLKPAACFPLRQRRSPRSLFHTSPIQWRKGNPKPKNDPVAEFFARFPNFKYNSKSAWPGEWKRLRRELDEQIQRAAIQRFQSTYSYDPSDLAACHKMCKVIGIVPPRTHEECRKAIKRLYINMVDLEHEGHQGNMGAVQQFPSEVALSEYTLRTGKIFCRHCVPEGSSLKCLLRNILNPQPEKARKGRTSDHRKKFERQIGAGSKQSEKRSG